MCLSPSNRPGDQYRYRIDVATGMRRRAGTTANVGIKVYGDVNESNAFLLRGADRPALTQASLDSFLVNTSESLGDLTHMRLWHDNSGPEPAWFVKEIAVQDIQTGQVWFFLCNCWLAVDSGDAQIDKVFAVSSREDLIEFKHLFVTKACQNLTDSHLWFSIVWRPPLRHFTRVQRLSCCLSLLLCTMMANVMWYQTDVGRYTEVKLGPVSFSWEQVSIGISSSLVVFPINLLLVQIFRHCKPFPPNRKNEVSPMKAARFSDKKAKKRNGSNKWCFISSIVNTARCNSIKNSKNSKSVKHFKLEDSCSESPRKRHNTTTKSNSKTGGGLPPWCVYVGWMAVVCTSMGAAAVTLLYGVQFGKKKSEQWLLSLFISIFQDIFVSQPLKVIVISLFFAYILKKPDTSVLQDSNNNNSVTEVELTENGFKQAQEPVMPPEKPSEEFLRKMRERIEKERQMCAVVMDIATYFVFTCLTLLIAYGHRDSRAYQQSTAVRETFVDRPFLRRVGDGNMNTLSKVGIVRFPDYDLSPI